MNVDEAGTESLPVFRGMRFTAVVQKTIWSLPNTSGGAQVKFLGTISLQIPSLPVAKPSLTPALTVVRI